MKRLAVWVERAQPLWLEGVSSHRRQACRMRAKPAYGGAAGAGLGPHLDVLAADLAHLTQEALQLLLQLPVMTWGTPSLIEDGKDLGTREQKEWQAGVGLGAEGSH